MKSILCGVLIFYGSIGQAVTAIHSDCSDQTFAYNAMEISEDKESLIVELSGATVFNLVEAWESSAVSRFKLDKSGCRFSKDRLLFLCYAKKVVVTRSDFTSSGSEPHIKRYIPIENLSMELSYVESLSSLARSAFKLVTSYGVNGSEQRTSNEVLFHGVRDLGCRLDNGFNN